MGLPQEIEVYSGGITRHWLKFEASVHLTAIGEKTPFVTMKRKFFSKRSAKAWVKIICEKNGGL